MQELEKGRAILSCRELFSLSKTGTREHDEQLKCYMLATDPCSEQMQSVTVQYQDEYCADAPTNFKACARLNSCCNCHTWLSSIRL